MGWFARRVLVVRVEGSEAKECSVELDESLYRLLGGGRALAVYLYAIFSPEEPPGPFEPSNPLVVAPGFLVGSGLTTASKTAFVSRSPQTGLLGRSMCGGRVGLEIRRLGFDALVVVGSADEPSVLEISCEGVRLHKASDLWGTTVSEARSRLLKRFPGYATAIIGPAGEKLSAMACIDADGRQAGRTGLGAVMGSKKLKALVVKGCRELRPADPQTALELARKLNEETLKHPTSERLSKYGTPSMVRVTGWLKGVLPSLNWRRSTLRWCPDPEKAVKELAEFAAYKSVRKAPCVGCGRPCSHVVATPLGEVDGPEYETVYALGVMLGICSIDDVALLNKLADEYGLDTISLGATIAWALEAAEKGMLELEASWGDAKAVAKLIEDIALRRGVGDLLADGVAQAVKRLGRGAEFAIHVKGLELPAYDARALKGMALGFAVASRGADHLTSCAYAPELFGEFWVYKGVDPLSTEGKGVLVKNLEDLMGYYDATGICKFSRATLTPEKVSDFASALTGHEFSAGELLAMGERTVNIERLLNLWMGMRPEDDWLPPRLLREPISDGPYRGSLVSENELKNMIAEYYAARGWSPRGVPSRATMMRLDLLSKLPDKLVRLCESRV